MEISVPEPWANIILLLCRVSFLQISLHIFKTYSLLTETSQERLGKNEVWFVNVIVPQREETTEFPGNTSLSPLASRRAPFWNLKRVGVLHTRLSRQAQGREPMTQQVTIVDSKGCAALWLPRFPALWCVRACTPFSPCLLRPHEYPQRG